MSIQTGEGLIRIDADDPQFTYRGVTLALKVRSIMWPVVLLCIKKTGDEEWTVYADITGDLFGSDVAGEPDAVAYWLKYHGGGAGFVREVVLPHLNDALARLFPAGEALPPLEQIHAALGGVRFVPQPDGTLKVTV